MTMAKVSPYPLISMSIDGLALTSAILVDHTLPIGLRAEAADCLCYAFATAKLHGQFIETVVKKAGALNAVATVLAVGSGFPQHHTVEEQLRRQETEEQRRNEWLQLTQRKIELQKQLDQLLRQSNPDADRVKSGNQKLIPVRKQFW